MLFKANTHMLGTLWLKCKPVINIIIYIGRNPTYIILNSPQPELQFELVFRNQNILHEFVFI